MVDNEKLIELLKGKESYTEKIIKKLLEAMPDLEKELAVAIDKTLNLLKDGEILAPAELQAAYIELDKQVELALTRSGYRKEVNKFVADFVKIQTYNGRVHKLVNDITINPKNFNPLLQATASFTVDKMLKDGMRVEFTIPVQQTLAINASGGVNITKAKRAIKAYLEGTNGEPRLFNYVESTARNSVFQYDGMLNAQISEQYGLTDFIYAGSLLVKEKGKDGKPLKGTGSRPQCVRWVGKGRIKGSELPKELAWAYANGSGMIAGTIPSNFAVNRGGWGCRHQAIPISPELETDIPDGGLVYEL